MHERRFQTVEMRATEDEGMIIEGYPIVYNQETDLGFFREMILPGAAVEALKRSDEFVLFNHDASKPLARRKNGTLEVSEDEKGVFIRADLSKSALGPDMYRDIKSGLIDKMSFAFTVEAETWAEEKGKKDLRTITRFDQLYDYSPVTYPAYSQTELVARSAEAVAEAHRTATAESEPAPAEEIEATGDALDLYKRRLRLIELEGETV